MNAWAGLVAIVSLGISATIAWSGGSGSAWVSVGSGSALLDIIQVGVRAGDRQPGDADYPDASPHFFAAWGDGTPEAGHYIEIDLGPADTKAHRYGIRWDGAAWELSIDGRVRKHAPPAIWTARNVRAMAESHDGPLPRVDIRKVRRLTPGGWTRDGLSYVAVGIGAQRPAWGRDWMSTR